MLEVDKEVVRCENSGLVMEDQSCDIGVVVQQLQLQQQGQFLRHEIIQVGLELDKTLEVVVVIGDV